MATASLLAGFGVAGFYFGTFSHVFPQRIATNVPESPYGVVFLSSGAMFAGFLPNANFTNATGGGPCQNLTANGTNTLNNTSASNPINLSASNPTNSINATTTYICLNAVLGGNITYQWNFINGTYGGFANYTAWDNTSAPVSNNTTANNNTAGWYNISLFNITGNANLTASSLNISGCNPVWTNISGLLNCRWFAGNNNTTFLPHAGFYAANGSWVSQASNASPDPVWWHPNQSGYLPDDSVYQATVAFANYTPAGMTYQIQVFFGGATPVPQVYYVNTGAGGQNETVTFVFDMSLAWTTALAGNLYGESLNNTTIIANIGSVSVLVSQCYVDATGSMVCPEATAPIYGSILA